ncbi:MAG: glycosyltransferase family 1 protein [Cytophagales bacterium]|nr:MAG: glycosyltransferase family 1 protein [Cytophagales bacterium]
MKKIKVLMIGWEFPPIINGGLGVACYGLSKALSNKVDLTIILPKTDISFSLNNINFIGLNNIDLNNIDIDNQNYKYEEFANTIEIAAKEFSPYPNAIDKLKNEVLGNNISEATDSNNLFSGNDLYGDNVMLRVYKFADYVAKIASSLEFDIIHCHDWMSFPAGIKIKKQSQKPLLIHIHSLEFDRSGIGSKNWVYEIEKEAIANADLIVPVSNYTGNIAIQNYEAQISKIYPVHNGTEFTAAFHQRKEFPEKLVLFLGRVTGQKGPQYFLEIASLVLKHYQNVRFVVAGTGDQLRDMIENGAYKNIGTKFHFTGFLTKDKVNQLLSMADVYCMPSVSEPFGLSALEAAQFGIPCVISKQSGVSEVLYGALKADYWDVEKMASHVISLLTNNALREALVKDAYQDLKSCSWEKASEKIVEIYHKAI